MRKKICVCVLLSILLTGCSTGDTTAAQKFTFQLFAMDTVMDFTIYNNNDAPLREAAQLINKLEHAFSVTESDSELYRLNQNHHASLSEDASTLLETALELCRKTQGALDISIYPVVRAWGFTSDTYRIPSDSELQSLLAHVDYRKISYDSEKREVTLPQNMEIDLGSVAKGYTGDRITRLFREKGITSALLNLGGNVQALGSKPDGSPWKIGIRDPMGDSYLGILSITDKAVITSGGYERYFEGPEGQIYWHIIDPATGRPAKNGLISATAVGKEGVCCDALSTSLFIMGKEKATEFWKTAQDFQMILVTDQGEVLITPGLTQDFHLIEGSSYKLQVIAND